MKMSLTNKIDFAVVFSVKNANPNGDPLDGNRPRTNYSGTGEVSDVCIKRKIRNRLMNMVEQKTKDKESIEGLEVFVQSDDNKLDECKSLRERAEIVIDAKKTPSENATLACKKWFDVRAFGQVFAYTAKSGKKGEGVSIPIRGPVSIHTAFSVDKVSITSTQITKSASGEGDGSKKGSDTMGMKHRVDEAVYVFYGSMNPQLASKTGFSDADAKEIKGILPKLFENDASSARPDGSMEVLKVVWWQHNSPHGQYSSAKVHRSISVNADGSIECAKLDGLNPESIDGF
jgi:CRISPR-associated protein Csd2